MAVICRRNKHFYEFLLIPNGLVLSLPQSLPSRYNSRVLRVTSNYTEVSSAIDSEVLQVRLQSILSSNGVWVVPSDCEPRGCIQGEIEGIPQFMGIRISEEACKAIISVSKKAEFTSPLVVYHGTSSDNVHQIIDQGLIPTVGMLGEAIYTGTFWKAARFACFKQDYSKRYGSIFRILAFPDAIAEFPRSGWSCSCGCNDLSAIICDHVGIWKTSFTAAHASVTPSIGLTRSGDKKYLLKNEEWAFKKECSLVLTHWANIEIDGMHYDPTSRSATIT